MSRRLTVVPSERHLESSPESDITTWRRWIDKVRACEPARRLEASTALLCLVVRGYVLSHPLDQRSGPPARGLIGLAHQTLGQLRRAGTSAQDLERTETARGRWLGALMRTLDQTLSRLELYDPRQLPARDTVQRFVEQQPFDLKLTATLSFDADLLRFTTDLQAELSKRGKNLSLELPSVPGETSIASLANWLEGRLAEEPNAFELEWRKTNEPNNVWLTECAGPEAEAREAAFRVREALDAGAAPERIAIVLPRRDESFEEPLRAALFEAQIPFSEAGGPSVFASPEARLVLDLIEMAHGQLDRDKLVVLLTTPGLHPGSLVRETDENQAVERARALASRLRNLPVIRDRDGKLMVEALAATLRESWQDPERNEKVNELWMVPALEALLRVFERLREAPSLAAIVNELLATIDRLRLGDPSASELLSALSLEGASSTPIRRLPLRAMAEGAVAVRAVRQTLESILAAAKLLGISEEPYPLSDLGLELVEQLEGFATTARGAASRLCTVRIASLREVAGIEHELLVFPQMLSSAYATREQSSLLDEATQAELPSSRRPASLFEKNRESASLLEWALVSAKTAQLSFPQSGSDGRPIEPPHPVVKSLRERATVRREPASRVHANARLLSQRGAELQALSQGAKPAKELRARIELERTRAAFFRSKRAPSVETGLVDPAHVDLPSMFGGATRERPISVTMVDRAISCPFRAFVERALGVRRAEELSDTHGPRERGTLLHRALHVAFDEDKRIRGTHSPEQRLLACRQVIEQELAREPFGVLRAEGVRRIREEAVAVVEFDLQREHDALYHKGEQRFSSREGSAYPALALRASNGLDVWLEGQIDRIDVNASGTMARVIDYKTGKVQTKRIGVTQLQLPLYAAVLRENGFSQTEACYISVGATGAISVQPSKPDEQKWPDDKLIDVKTQAADVIVSLWQGLVPPRPESPSACKHCEHRGICRRPAIALELEDE